MCKDEELSKMREKRKKLGKKMNGLFIIRKLKLKIKNVKFYLNRIKSREMQLSKYFSEAKRQKQAIWFTGKIKSWNQSSLLSSRYINSI